jgi:hypothetical protein
MRLRDRVPTTVRSIKIRALSKRFPRCKILDFDVHYGMNTLKAESAIPTLWILNGLRAIVAWVLEATLLQHDTFGKLAV